MSRYTAYQVPRPLITPESIACPRRPIPPGLMPQLAGNMEEPEPDQHPCKERSEDHIWPTILQVPTGEDQLFFAAIHRRELFPILGKLSFKCLANDQILKETAD